MLKHGSGPQRCIMHVFCDQRRTHHASAKKRPSLMRLCIAVCVTPPCSSSCSSLLGMLLLRHRRSRRRRPPPLRTLQNKHFVFDPWRCRVVTDICVSVCVIKLARCFNLRTGKNVEGDSMSQKACMLTPTWSVNGSSVLLGLRNKSALVA